MKSNFKIANLLVIIGIFGFSSVVLAQKTAPNKAQAKASAKSATPKKAKNVNTGEVKSSNSGTNRPASTGSGNGNNRPASTGETLSEIDLLDRSYFILVRVARYLPNDEIRENSGANAARASSFSKAASENAFKLREAYLRETTTSDGSLYGPNNLSSMQEAKEWLEKALSYLNRIEYGFRNNKADAIEKTQQAIAQAQAYIDNPPAPTKVAPNGAEVYKGKGQKGKIGATKKAVNTNMINSTLKTNPAGSSAPAKPAKTTNIKAKASSQTTKPANNLDPLDGPWGKKTKKP